MDIGKGPNVASDKKVNDRLEPGESCWPAWPSTTGRRQKLLFSCSPYCVEFNGILSVHNTFDSAGRVLALPTIQADHLRGGGRDFFDAALNEQDALSSAASKNNHFNFYHS